MLPDDFRQLGTDLLEFAKNPEAMLGVFKALSLEGDPLHVKHRRETRRWEVIWTRYVNSAASTDFTWCLLKGATQLQHALLVARDERGAIQRFVLSYMVFPEVIYEIHYEVDRDDILGIMFTMRSTRSTELLPFGTPPMPLNDVLKYVPSGMTPSLHRAELASVTRS